MIYVALVLTLALGIGLGIRIAEAVANQWTREGRMFFYHPRRKMWVGDKDKIIKFIKEKQCDKHDPLPRRRTD